MNKDTQSGTQEKRLEGGLVVRDLVEGSGPVARPGKFVHVNYVGRLTNKQVFDRTRNKPFSFKLGTGEVIKGWDLGIKGMRVGGKRKVVVPSGLG